MDYLPKLSLVQVFVLCVCAWGLGSMIVISELRKSTPAVAGVATTASNSTPTEGISPSPIPTNVPTISPTATITIAPVSPTVTHIPTRTPTIVASATPPVSSASVDKKYCDSASDCVAVSCGCSCSGCGGFSYQDVVNKSHEGEWYDTNTCEPAQMCPMVCCAPATIACENHQCVVHGGDKLQ